MVSGDPWSQSCLKGSYQADQWPWRARKQRKEPWPKPWGFRHGAQEKKHKDHRWSRRDPEPSRKAEKGGHWEEERVKKHQGQTLASHGAMGEASIYGSERTFSKHWWLSAGHPTHEGQASMLSSAHLSSYLLLRAKHVAHGCFSKWFNESIKESLAKIPFLSFSLSKLHKTAK